MFDFNILPKKIQNNIYCQYRQKYLMLSSLRIIKKIIDIEHLDVPTVNRARIEYMNYIKSHELHELVLLEENTKESKNKKAVH